MELRQGDVEFQCPRNDGRAPEAHLRHNVMGVGIVETLNSKQSRAIQLAAVVVCKDLDEAIFRDHPGAPGLEELCRLPTTANSRRR